MVIAGSRLPVACDRRGLRWLLGGKVMPGGPLVVLTHRGRRTGRRYSSVVEALVHDIQREEIIVTSMRGSRADWYRNIVAGGLVRLRFKGRTYGGTWRIPSEDETRAALRRYRLEHPVFGRLVTWGMARGHAPHGDTVSAAADACVLLAIKTSGAASA